MSRIEGGRFILEILHFAHDVYTSWLQRREDEKDKRIAELEEKLEQYYQENP